jgi:hypothetical protein
VTSSASENAWKDNAALRRLLLLLLLLHSVRSCWSDLSGLLPPPGAASRRPARLALAPGCTSSRHANAMTQIFFQLGHVGQRCNHDSAAWAAVPRPRRSLGLLHLVPVSPLSYQPWRRATQGAPGTQHGPDFTAALACTPSPRNPHPIACMILHDCRCCCLQRAAHCLNSMWPQRARSAAGARSLRAPRTAQSPTNDPERPHSAMSARTNAPSGL